MLGEVDRPSGRDGGGLSHLSATLPGMPRPVHTRRAGRHAVDLRRTLTISEARLWRYLRGSKAGARFRRQVPIGHWIADFASFDPKLVIEVDDTSHQWRDEFERTAHIRSRGFYMLRFTNRQVAVELNEVIETIRFTVERLRSGLE